VTHLFARCIDSGKRMISPPHVETRAHVVHAGPAGGRDIATMLSALTILRLQRRTGADPAAYAWPAGAFKVDVAAAVLLRSSADHGYGTSSTNDSSRRTITADDDAVRWPICEPMTTKLLQIVV